MAINNLFDKSQFRVPQDVIDRMTHIYPNYPDLSDKEYANLIDVTEITYEEFNVIHAMQTDIALAMLEDKLNKQPLLELQVAHNWIEPYRKNKFAGYQEAVRHLEKVDRYFMGKYHHHYALWYIDSHNEISVLDWSTEMVDRAINKFGEKRKPKKNYLSSYE